MNEKIKATIAELAEQHGAQPSVMSEYLLQKWLQRKITAQKWAMPHMTNKQIEDIVLR